MACVYCGDTVEDGATLTLDHVLARNLGGGNEATNLVTCCLSCNSSKQDLVMRDWTMVLRDRGVDTTELPKRIRRHTRRVLDMKAAKALMARR
jgi:5-methylcytosine-specific restriction endonuclease McrA